MEVKNLKKYFLVNSSLLGIKKEFLKAVDDVSFKIKKGETFAIVGESGCGKSTLGQTILGLTSANSGKIIFDGIDFLNLSKKEFRKKEQKFK